MEIIDFESKGIRSETISRSDISIAYVCRVHRWTCGHGYIGLAWPAR